MSTNTTYPEQDEINDFGTIWDCDWEDAVCPVCGHDLGEHNARTITRCANAR
jgi:hypothetical protein